MPGQPQACALALLVGALGACEGAQSSLAPAAPAARDIATLFWWMSASATLLWLGVLALSWYATRHVPSARDERRARWLIVGGGAILPTVALTVLLVYGLGMLPKLLEQGPGSGPRIHVTGEQWWWRVRYALPGGESFELANELRIPVGERVPLWLYAKDVIHSFWVPSLAGKVDMIPGRVTRVGLQADHDGTFLGACAEFCGSAHAQMRLHVRALPRASFERWLADQRRPALRPSSARAHEGERLFTAVGCAACHAVRGSAAVGSAGPDLTHVGSRLGIGAALLNNDVAAFQRWLGHPAKLKPGVHMPGYAVLGPEQLLALSTYLDGLR